MAEFPLDVTVNMQLRSPGETVDITEDVRVDTPITVKRGRSDETESADPAKASFKLNNRHGKYSPRNPNSPYFGRIGLNTRITVSIGADRRFVGAVSEWPSRWDLSGEDVWVPLRASGLTRRLGQGRDNPRSSLRRFMDSSDPQPHAYWALDGGELSDLGQLTSGSGGPWATGSGTPLYGDSLLAPWLSTGMTLKDDGGMFSTVSGVSRTEAAVAVDHARRSPGGGSGQSIVAVRGVDDDGVSFGWIISFAPGASQEILVVLRSGGAFVDSWGPFSVPSLFTDDVHHFRFLLEVDGASTDWSVLVDGETVASDTSVGGFTGVTNLESNYNPGDATELVQGHWAVWTSSPGIVAAADVVHAMNGFRGETSGRRMERLADEEGVSVLTRGDLDATPAMGPQRVADFLDLLRECEEADMGVLYDSRLLGSNPTQIEYRTRGTLYNQEPLLVLDYSSGEIFEPVEPTDDDQRTFNDVTVKREEGNEVRRTDLSGPRGVSSVGRYSTSVTLNVDEDAQLPDQAAWRLHLGTVDELRVPVLHLNLHNPRMAPYRATLSALSGGLEPGDRIRVVNTPPWIVDDLDLIVQGYTESFSLFSWDFELVCTPASPWNVLELDDGELGRLDTAGSELDADIDSTETEVLVTTTDGPVWVTDDGLDPTDDGDLPVDVRVGGEVMTATGIEPAAWDDFNRLESSTWSDAESGQGWVENGGAASDRSVFIPSGTSGVVAGIITLQADPATIRTQTLGEDIADCDIRVLMGVDQIASGASFLPAILMRWTGPFNFYRARVQFNTDQSMSTDVTRSTTVIGSVQDLPWTYENANDLFWVRARLDGHRVRVRVWPQGTAEPDIWHNDQTVSSATIERGDVGVSASAFDGNDNTDPELIYDDFQVVSPQRFTVTRSVNGVTKPHSAGDSLSLAHPAVLAL